VTARPQDMGELAYLARAFIHLDSQYAIAMSELPSWWQQFFETERTAGRTPEDAAEILVPSCAVGR
jgi:hypothetical protein